MKINYQLVLIIVLAVFLRAWNVDSVFYSDELPWPYAAADHSHAGFNFIIDLPGEAFPWTSPPLAPLLYRLFSWPVEVSHVTLRLLPLILGIVNILLAYRLARKLFDERTALVAAFIMSISFWHVIESFLVEHDGSILMLFWLLFFNIYLDYERSGKKSLVIWLGIILGLALLTKLTGALVMIALAAYLIWKNWENIRTWQIKKLREPFFLLLKSFLIGIGIFLVFPILSYLISPSYLSQTFGHSEVLTWHPTVPSIARILAYLALWATPMLAGIAVLSVFGKKISKKIKTQKYALLWSWILTVIVFYSFTRYLGAIDRYMSVIIPPLCILAGIAVSRIEGKKLKVMAIASAILIEMFIALNTVPSEWIAHDASEYARRAASFDWLFIFQFHGSGGPAFMSSFLPIGIALLLCAALFVGVIASRNKKIASWLLVFFISSSLAFNIFLVETFIIKSPYPDASDGTKSIISYINENRPAAERIYMTDRNIAWYIRESYPGEDIVQFYQPIGDKYTDTQEEIAMISQNIQGSVVIISNYPKRPSDDNVWKVSEGCSLVMTAEERGYALGYVYRC